MLVVVLGTAGTHIAGDIAQLGRGIASPIGSHATQHTHDILTIVFVRDIALWIWQTLGFNLQILALGERIWAIYIEAEVRHYEEVVPQLVGCIGTITQMRVEVTHHRNHSLGLTSALIAILNLEQRVDHLLNMTTILGNQQRTA